MEYGGHDTTKLEQDHRWASCGLEHLLCCQGVLLGVGVPNGMGSMRGESRAAQHVRASSLLVYATMCAYMRMRDFFFDRRVLHCTW